MVCLNLRNGLLDLTESADFAERNFCNIQAY